jgi:hypothetical protein
MPVARFTSENAGNVFVEAAVPASVVRLSEASVEFRLADTAFQQRTLMPPEGANGKR